MSPLAVRTADQIDVVFPDPAGCEYQFGSRAVQVYSLSVKFRNEQFELMTLFGRFVGGDESSIDLTVHDPKVLPRWAVPWSVFLAWEIAE